MRNLRFKIFHKINVICEGKSKQLGLPMDNIVYNILVNTANLDRYALEMAGITTLPLTSNVKLIHNGIILSLTAYYPLRRYENNNFGKGIPS